MKIDKSPIAIYRIRLGYPSMVMYVMLSFIVDGNIIAVISQLYGTPTSVISYMGYMGSRDNN